MPTLSCDERAKPDRRRHRRLGARAGCAGGRGNGRSGRRRHRNVLGQHGRVLSHTDAASDDDDDDAASGSTTPLARQAQALGSRTLRMGAKGTQVRVLQRVLTAVGYRVRVTGYFGPLTRAQVRRFQKNWTLPIVGYVGPATAKALRDALAGRKPPARNAQPVAPAVSVNGWTFPIRGAHNYGDAADRYGAPRDGHTHAGQDILASCGLPEVAARGGRVIDTGYGGSAGYYIAVHTTDTPYDYFYAHLRSASIGEGGPDGVHGPARRLRRRDRRRRRLPPALRAVGRRVVERRAHDRPAALPEGLGQVAPS